MSIIQKEVPEHYRMSLQVCDYSRFWNHWVAVSTVNLIEADLEADILLYDSNINPQTKLLLSDNIYSRYKEMVATV